MNSLDSIVLKSLSHQSLKRDYVIYFIYWLRVVEIYTFEHHFFGSISIQSPFSTSIYHIIIIFHIFTSIF